MNESEGILTPELLETLSILSKKWTFMIIAVLFHQDSRFKDLRKAIPGISDRVLVERLKELESEELVRRPIGQEDNPRAGYQLTEKGQDLGDTLKALHTWAKKWY